MRGDIGCPAWPLNPRSRYRLWRRASRRIDRPISEVKLQFACSLGFRRMSQRFSIAIGHAEAFSLAARLGGIAWRRPMTYQFVAALVQALGGRVRQVRIDRVVERAYAATVEVEGPPGVQAVDARPSDALNLAALVQAPIFVAPEVLVDAEARRTGDSPEAARLRKARVAQPITFGVELSE